MRRRGADRADIVEDDDRVIADMSMLREPWYKRARRHARSAEPPVQGEAYTPANAREWARLLSGSLLAGLLIAALFIAAGALFILFCTNIWLK